MITLSLSSTKGQLFEPQTAMQIWSGAEQALQVIEKEKRGGAQLVLQALPRKNMQHELRLEALLTFLDDHGRKVGARKSFHVRAASSEHVLEQIVTISRQSGSPYARP